MRICIVGVGNIGMRYVQGITRKYPEAQLVLIDHGDRLGELEKLQLANTKLLSSIEKIEDAIDIFVVSTSCDSRLSIYRRCLEQNPKYIILEKYLFKSREEFEECLSLQRVPTFVNQWMYGSKTFDCLFEQQATSVKLEGSGWGLACNAVHWIDVFKRHMNIAHLQAGSATAIADVFPSKRAGYEEISGVLEFVDRDSDKSFSLVDKKNARLANMLRIEVDERVYSFDYSKVVENGRILSHFPYFSELIGGIVGEIMRTGKSALPLLEDSIPQHLLIEEMLESLDRRPRIT